MHALIPCPAIFQHTLVGPHPTASAEACTWQDSLSQQLCAGQVAVQIMALAEPLHFPDGSEHDPWVSDPWDLAYYHQTDAVSAEISNLKSAHHSGIASPCLHQFTLI